MSEVSASHADRRELRDRQVALLDVMELLFLLAFGLMSFDVWKSQRVTRA